MTKTEEEELKIVERKIIRVNTQLNFMKIDIDYIGIIRNKWRIEGGIVKRIQTRNKERAKKQ